MASTERGTMSPLLAPEQDRELNYEVSHITSDIAKFKFSTASTVGHDLAVAKGPTRVIVGELDLPDTDDSTHSFSRSLLFENEENSTTLDIYKDILTEKIHSKSKIPTPAPVLRSARPRIPTETLPRPESKLPVSIAAISGQYRSPYKRSSMISMRSVSESPSRTPKKRLQRPAKLPISPPSTHTNNPPSNKSFSDSRRRVQSMILSSRRSDPHHFHTPLQVIPATPPNKHIPSYLKQTTSSMKKANANPHNKENNFVHPRALPTASKDFVTTTSLNIPKIRRKPALNTTLNLTKDPLTRRASFLAHNATKTAPKIAPKPGVEPQLEPRKVRRSLTQDKLNQKPVVGDAPRLRRISSSMEKRKSSLELASTRVSSIRLAKKIGSVADLYRTVSKSPLVKSWEKSCNYKFSRISPISPDDLARHSRYKLLNNYERGEILRRSLIYYVGDRPKQEVQVSNVEKNFGFDDKNNNYIIEAGDHINYRFRVLATLGNGAFGSVVSCNDYKTDRVCAVKIVKNEMTCSLQLVNEVKLLRQLSTLYGSPSHNVIQYYNHFHFRGHMCIVTEFLPINLYQTLELSDFRGFDIDVIAVFAQQILSALQFLHCELGIIHCDLKPENLMLVSPHSFDLKLIDFGSAVNINEISYSYLQSRFYRAPEVALGLRYNEKIDIWSFACILVELFSGLPLFPCENENDLMLHFVDLLGLPEPHYIARLHEIVLNEGAVGEELNDSTMLWRLFDRKGHFLEQVLQRRMGSKKVKIKSRNLQVLLKISTQDENYSLEVLFVEFIQCCLRWDYELRQGAEQLLSHEFIRRA